MISRRTWLRLVILLSLLAFALGSYTYLSWTRLLERQQIEELDWQGLSLDLDGIALARLDVRQRQAGGSLQLQVEQLRLRWTQLRLSPPFWQQVQIASLKMSLPQPAATTAPDGPEPSVQLEQLGAALALLPGNLDIQRFVIDLPCAAQRCSLQGDLQLSRPNTAAIGEQSLAVQLNLQHQQHQLNWTAQWQGNNDAVALQLALAVDQVPQLSLASRLWTTAEGQAWQGQLSSASLSQAAVLQSWLQQWLPVAQGDGMQAPTAAKLLADWQLQLGPGPLRLSQLLQASGQISASADLPEPWPVPGIGLLQGQFNLAARALDGQWFADSLGADLQLAQISSAALQALPANLRPESLHLQIKAADSFDALAANLLERALPLSFSLSSQGSSRFDLQGRLALANAAPWALQLADASLTVNSPGLTLGDWVISDLRSKLALSGYLDEQQLTLALGQGSQLSLGQLQGAEMRMQQLKASSNALHLSAQHQAGVLQSWQLQGPTSLSLQQLHQAQLKPQGWQWQGQLAASEAQIKLDGKLGNDADLQLSLQLQHSNAAGLTLQAKLAELFLRSGNPLQQSFSAWPALLNLSDGRLNAKASLSLATNASAPSGTLELTGKGLGGIYDRTELSGLDTRLQLQLDPRQVKVELQELQLQQANPGIPLGPLQFSASYQAPLATLDKGRLQVRQARGELVGGSVQLDPGQWNLAEGDLLLPLRVRGLELEQLFILYPTEGLAGSGTLDGLLPLRLGSAGATIEQGQLAARQPGGQLQFHSERIRALGRSNPAMQLVTQSLEDFRYATLSSQVNYDQHGKLQLDIRLEGQNPAIEKGRPIHFNISLEEDIPTLLASLQLTDKVNEIIKQRVQQRMLERQTAPQEP